MAKYETPDPQPLALPAGFKEPESLEQQIRRLIRSEEWAEQMNNAGNETFEESEDFDIDDDSFDPGSPYEEIFDPTLGRGITHDEFMKHRDVYEKRYQEAWQKAFSELDRSEALRGRRRPAEQSGREATPKDTPAKPVDKAGS